ncbi:MAG: hypothetical protein ACI4XC_03270 [Eubacterium sp.]
MKNIKNSFVFGCMFSAVISTVCFCVLYFGIYRISFQTPDNHLAVYNLFGIFYKDLFWTSLITQLAGTLFLSIVLSFDKNQKAYQTALSFLVSIALSALGGWFCSWVGSYLNSLPNLNASVQILLQLAVLFINLFLIYFALNSNKEKKKVNEI